MLNAASVGDRTRWSYRPEILDDGEHERIGPTIALPAAMRALSLLMAVSLLAAPACTFVGAATGGIAGAIANPHSGKPATYAVVGGAVGLVVDIVIASAFIAAVEGSVRSVRHRRRELSQLQPMKWASAAGMA